MSEKALCLMRDKYEADQKKATPPPEEPVASGDEAVEHQELE